MEVSSSKAVDKATILVVDDSPISSRVYRKAMTHAQVVVIILEGRATHFDPDIVDAFACLQEQFREISR